MVCLDVAVCDVVAMVEAEHGDELLEVAACSGLREAAMIGDLGEKLAAAGEVDDEILEKNSSTARG